MEETCTMYGAASCLQETFRRFPPFLERKCLAEVFRHISPLKVHNAIAALSIKQIKHARQNGPLVKGIMKYTPSSD